MKKTSIILSALVAGMMAACTSGTPKANLTSDIDTLSYAIGMAQSQGLKDYLSMRMGVDTAYMDAFIKGFNESAKSGEDKKQNAYYAGLQIGQQVSQQMVKSINDDLFGSDSTQTISLDNFMAGFVAGTTGKGGLMTVDSASTVAQTKMQQVKARHMEEVYGDNKKQCEEFMANIAKKEGIKALDNGVYYEVLTEGKGEIPSDTSRVKVHYEGRLINDTIFDSSYQRNKPMTVRLNSLIKGWAEAMKQMPAGSTWEVYIPQELAYGPRQQGPKIKPFSALVFKIELLEVK